ncbi:MAG: ABC transporter substrate-binding protein [Eubacteriales bacterium]|jgi:raffinose/stachyose/melibiose transport system substrate-binding protein
MRKIRQAAAICLSGVMAAGLLAGCGASSSTSTSSVVSTDSGDTSSTATAASTGVNITIFNSKSEIQSQMVKMAKQYTKETGVGVEVYYSSDTVAAHLSTRYASNSPYTISMVDAKDIYSLAKEHAVDLSDQDWVGDTDYAISIDGKVYGFPVCIEARGLIYNASAIEKITGEKFDPSKYKTLDEFKALLEKLVAGGMKHPVGIMKEDWSLGAHYLAQVYEEQSDPDAFINQLCAGDVDLMSNDKFNSLMDTFDVLKEYNYDKVSAVSAEREVSEEYLAEGKIAFMFGGNWDWSELNQYDFSSDMGMMPVPQNTDDGSNEKLVGGGSKYFFIDNSSNTSDAQRAAAEDFLNWWANNEEGQKFVVDTCALVPAFRTNTLEVQDPLGKSVKEYADAGKLINNYNFLPDDHYAVLGAEMQKYLANVSTRKQFAKAIEKYWKTATPIAH